MSKYPARVRIFRALTLVPVAISGVAYFVGGLETAGDGFMFTSAIAFGAWVMPGMMRKAGILVK